MPNATESNAQRSITNRPRPARRPAGLRQAADAKRLTFIYVNDAQDRKDRDLD